jgi:imidazolonepropionase-like amidohydrolase
MRKFIAIAAFCLSATALSAQTETTFKTNGPDDFREGLHAFTNATIFTTYNQKVENATLLIQNGRVLKVLPAGEDLGGAGFIIHDMKGRFIYPSS